MKITINSNQTLIPELMGCEKTDGTDYPLANSIPAAVSSPLLLSVYYADYDDHIWALSWVMDYTW